MEVSSLSQIPLENTDLVLLDLDNTLYNYTTCHHNALDALAKGFEKHVGLDSIAFNTYYTASRNNVHKRLHGTAVSHSRLFYIQDMIEKLCHRTDTGMVKHLYNLYWDAFIANMECFPDTLPFLQYCKSEHIPVVMVTDMTAEIQFAKIEKLGIGGYFSYIVTSEETGLEKPDPFIFEYAIEKALRLKPVISTIAVVGDDVKKDVYGSELYEISVYHIGRDGSL